MNIKRITHNGMEIALLESGGIVMADAQSALDLMATVRYEYKCDRLAVPKTALAEDFFILSTGMAGEILQKFVNYRCMLAVIGDFSRYTSKPLRDFIRESNEGRHIFFVDTQEAAIIKLAGQP